MIRPDLVTGGMIALAVGLGAARVLWWRHRAGAPWSRSAALIALSVAGGGLLYLTLFPPPTYFARGTLVVATAGAPRDLKPGAGERLVALPEAGGIEAAERVPDLATVLRRDGRPARMRIVGAGLTERDRAAAAGVAIDFHPPAVPRGLIALEPPPATAAGSVFAFAGRTHGLDGATTELLDPAGRRVDARAVDRDGRFTLIGSARTPGLALFKVRLRAGDKAVAEEAVVPLWTVAEPRLKVLVLGSPGPETKYLRRWATDAGIDLDSQLDAGGGVRLGDAPVAISAATLGRFDALIVDDRDWQAMGDGARAAVAGAVSNGLGVIIRMTGPASPASRRAWATLGLAVGDDTTLAPVALAPQAIDAEALAAKRTPAATDAAAAQSAIDEPAPELGHWDIAAGPELVPLIRDDEGALLAGWRARGLGRAAIWTIADSYALVLAGQGDRYFQWWSDAVTAVARPAPQFAPELSALPRAGRRMTICGIGGDPYVTGPEGGKSPLALVAGCAAYWPAREGTHTLVQPGRGGGARPFHAYPADALPAEAANELAEATVALVGAPATGGADTGERPGPAWPWFLGWLAVSALLWWLERRRGAAA